MTFETVPVKFRANRLATACPEIIRGTGSTPVIGANQFFKVMNKSCCFQSEFTDGRAISALSAVTLIEDEEDENGEDTLRAWAFLIKAGLVWQLQGWYGRVATKLIDGGVISHQGVINREILQL